MTLRTVSYGGGVQSTALLVLAAQGAIDFSTFLFANTGDDSEHPDTLRFVRDVAMPWAAERDVEVVELVKVGQRGKYAGEVVTLRRRLDDGDMSIPVRRVKDGPPMSRSCTADFKIRVIEAELRRRGATPANPATVAIGISVDEIQRAKPGVDPRSKLQVRTYPLLELGLHRRDCIELIAAAGLEVPPKSSCYFCPYHDLEAWRQLKRNRPDLFADSVHLEQKMSAAASDGRPVFLTRTGRPLDQVLADDQLQLEGLGDDCDSGYCFT